MSDVSITAENVTELRSLNRGDHIAVEGALVAKVKYYHHGIFLGHSIGVADFGGTNKMTATIRVVDILEFTDLGRRRLVRYIYKRSECVSAEEAATTAEALAANPKLWGAYDLVDKNCEHFATRCKVGRAVSLQVLDSLRILAGVAACAAIATATAPHCSPASILLGGSLSAASSINLAKQARK